jgi:capsular polysaccharide biosynthesis protein/Mrp family chromosome partitioning ATPase
MSSISRPDSSAAVDYTGVLRRRWPIVLVVTLIGLLGAVGYILVAPKAYSSSASVYVSPTGADNVNPSSGGKSSGTVNLFTEDQVVTSGVVATLAGKSLHSSLTPYALAKEVKVSTPANSQSMVITCTTSTNTGAAACANAFAAAYLKHRSDSATAAIDQQIAPLKSQIGSLQKTVAALATKIGGLPKGSVSRVTAQTQLASDRAQLNSLNAKVAALYGAASQTNGGTIITPAGPPGSPSSPKKSLILPAGLAVGLVAGLIVAFAWDRRDKRIHTARDVERFFGLPVLLSLPKESVGGQVSLAAPRSRTGWAFTELAHAVAGPLGEGNHVVLVAGASPGPAASLVAANLAAALARTHSSAVLVCAALQDSVAPALFGLAPGAGLAEVLAGRAAVGEVAQGPASAPGLWVIPPGADTSLAEYSLQHDTAQALTSQLRLDARFVVIEMQAQEGAADTLALAEFADAVLLTVEAQRTSRDDADAAIWRLRQMRAQLLGAAVLPPVGRGVTVRPPRIVQRRPDARPFVEAEPGPDGSASGRGQISSLSDPAGGRKSLSGPAGSGNQGRKEAGASRSAGRSRR